MGEIGRLGSSVSKQMDAEVTSINGGAAPANNKDHHGSNASGFGGFALSAPSLFGGKLSSLQRHGLANGSTTETRLGEESNGSSDPDFTQANKVHETFCCSRKCTFEMPPPSRLSGEHV